ncbi:MAG: hypothetical protein R3B45_18390 [Bdellovibrionota bacterium]
MSKQARPQWIGVELDDWSVEKGAWYRYVEVKKQVSDILLGVKQAEKAAISHARQHLVRYFTNYVFELPAAENIMTKEIDRTKLEKFVAEIVMQKDFITSSYIADIYYEKLRVESRSGVLLPISEFYNIYVQVLIPKGKIQEAFSVVKGSLLKSKLDKLAALGKILQGYELLLTH